MQNNKVTLSFSLNGTSVSETARPMARLLDVLREGSTPLTGTKEGCGEGECGACAVLMNGKLVNSCLVAFAQVEGAQIETIEGMSHNKELHVLQKSFIENNGAQCGICTPGMLLACRQLLAKNLNPSEDEMKVALAGNLCRCTGYTKIFAAIREAAAKMREQA